MTAGALYAEDLAYRSFSRGRDWAVLVEVSEQRRRLVRDITTFRRLGAFWRRTPLRMIREPDGRSRNPRAAHGVAAAMHAPLRNAESGDLELLTRLLAEFYAESGYPFDEPAARAAIAALTADPGLGRFWVVLSGDEVVGYVAVTFGFSLEYLGRDAFVDDFYIREGFRGRGLGTRVMELVESACRELGVRALHLEVERENRRAQSLYRRRGFRDNERQLLTKRLRA